MPENTGSFQRAVGVGTAERLTAYSQAPESSSAAPGTGYVGVGKVTGPAASVNDF